MPRPRALWLASLVVLAIGAFPCGTQVEAAAAAPKPSCKSAAALAAAGDSEAATKEYVRLLEEDPAEGCASEGLTNLNKPAPATPTAAEKECVAGRLLLEAHRKEQALSVYESAAKNQPELECVAAGLHAAGPDSEGGVDWSRDAWIVLGIIVLIGLAAWLAPHFDWLVRQLRGVVILRSILKPRLDFEDVGGVEVDEKPGPAITTRIKKKLINMREEALQDAHEYDLDLARPREEFADFVSENGSLKTALEKASDISDQTKLAAALLSIAYTLLPIPRFVIGASLEPPTVDERASLTLLLEQKGKSAAAITLEGAKPKPAATDDTKSDQTTVAPSPSKATISMKPDGTATVELPEPAPAAPSPPAPEKHPNAGDYVRLADPAAVWIQFEIARALNGEPADEDASKSHALTLEGLELYEWDNFESAVEKYELALGLNRKNWSAYVCLAAAESRLGKDPAQSIRRIKEALKGLKGEK